MREYPIRTKTILGNINVTYLDNFGKTPHIGVELRGEILKEIQFSFQQEAEIYKINLV